MAAATYGEAPAAVDAELGIRDATGGTFTLNSHPSSPA